MVAAKQLMDISEEFMAMEEVKLQAKQKFIDNYLESYVWRAKNSTEAKNNFNKYVDVRLRPANKESKKTIDSIWEKMKQHFRHDKDSFLVEAMLSVHFGVKSFKPKSPETFDWYKLNEEESKENKAIHKYVNVVISKNAEKLSTFIAGKGRTERNDMDVFIKLDGLYESSLDQSFEGEDGEVITFHDTLGEESSIFHVRKDELYTPTHYMQFFYDNMGSLKKDENGEYVRDATGIAVFEVAGVLTRIQLEFYETVKDILPLANASHSLRAWWETKSKNEEVDEEDDDNSYTKGIWRDSSHPYTHLKTKYSRKQGTTMKQAIHARTQMAYQKAFPKGEPRLRNENEIKDGILLFKGFVDCVDKSGTDFLNRNVSNWIRNNFGETKVHHLIGDNFTDKEQFDINGCIMNSAVRIPDELIERFIMKAEMKLEELKKWNSVPKKFVKLRSAKEIANEEKRMSKQMTEQARKEGKKHMNLNLDAWGIEIDRDQLAD